MDDMCSEFKMIYGITTNQLNEFHFIHKSETILYRALFFLFFTFDAALSQFK